MDSSAGGGQGSRRSFSTFAVIAVLVASLIDQGTKLIVQRVLPDDVAIEIGRIFRIEHVHNSGFAFSFLSETGGLPVAVTIVAVVAIIGLWLRNADGGRMASLGFALALGGMMGNLIDRLRVGEVFDFLVFHVGEHNWFAANLADAEIVLGFLLLMFALPTRKQADGGKASERRGVRPTGESAE